MSDLICTTEYQDWVGDLPDEDYEFLAGELAGQVSVRREIRDGSVVCVVNPKQYVGAIALPSGLRIEIRPKTPIANLFYMLSIAFDFPWPFRDELIQLNSFDDLLAVIAQIFSDLVEERIHQRTIPFVLRTRAERFLCPGSNRLSSKIFVGMRSYDIRYGVDSRNSLGTSKKIKSSAK